MRLFISLILFCGSVVAAAQTPGMVYKDLASNPIVFDTALDLPDKSHTMALISSTTNLYAEVSCSNNITSGFHAYLDLYMYGKMGTRVGYGYVNFKSNGECQQSLRELFDHPAAFEFQFGPVNNFGSSPVEMRTHTKN